MKTLLIASNGRVLTESRLKIKGKPLHKFKLSYITTAGNDVPNRNYLERHRARMSELGFDFTELDIEGKDEQQIRQALADKDAVYVEGGNTFYLLKAVQESGFDKVVKDLILNGLIYMGASAGAYIACPTIEMATWKNPTKFNRHGVTDFTAMNLVPFLVTVHYTPEYRELLQEKIYNCQYPVKILADDQALLVQDGQVKFVGSGEEVQL